MLVRMTARGEAVDQRPPLTWRRRPGPGGHNVYEDATDPQIRVVHDGTRWHGRLNGVELVAAATRREATEAVVARLQALEDGAVPLTPPPALGPAAQADDPPGGIEDLVAVAEAAHVMRERLQREGFSVMAAQDGLEALDRARQDLPDAIVLNLLLRRIDGLRVCEILKSNPATTNIPVLLTAGVHVDADAHGRPLGGRSTRVRRRSRRRAAAGDERPCRIRRNDDRDGPTRTYKGRPGRAPPVRR